MTKQHKSSNSNHAKKPFATRHMLRLALVAGVVGGFASPSFAQTDLTLPAFPAESTGVTLPASQDAALPSAFVEAKQTSPLTSQRVAMLLGLKKVASSGVTAGSSPIISLPSFPSTEPCTSEQTSTSKQVATNSQAPTIFRSTSGKTDNANTARYTTSISLASADESLSEIEIPPTLTVQASAPVEDAIETESLDISLADLRPAIELTPQVESIPEQAEALAETLLDIEVPQSVVQLPQTLQPLPTTVQDQPSSSNPQLIHALPLLNPLQTEQLSPEIVQRIPAIQLHIGGGMGVQSSFSDSDQTEEQAEEQTQASPANYSMSDADDNASVSTAATKTAPKTLKVRIEGEPAQVVSRSIASSEASEAPQKTLSFDPASFSIASANTETHRKGIQSLGGQITNSQSAADFPIAAGPVGGTVVSLPNLSSPSPVAQAETSQRLGTSSNNSQPLDIPTLVSQGPTHVAPTANATPIVGTEVKPTIGARLEVGLHEASSVETTQPISGLSVEHPELCQVLKSSERSVSLVGLKSGQTRVALFTTSASGERKIEIREVLIAGTENRQADMNSMAAEISKSVRRMYPSSRIEVIAEDDGLAVQGYAGSEAEAKKIISLIRRTSLQPVIDRLATYK